MNNIPILDQKYDIYQRVITFESMDCANSNPVRSKTLLKKLESICR